VNICIIGNSHIAAAKLGWDAISKEFPQHTIEFFGFPPNTSLAFAANTRLKNGHILPTTDLLKRGFDLTAGKPSIRGPNYSAFVTIGMGLGGPLYAVRTTCGKHRLAQHVRHGEQLISRSFLVAAIDDALRSELALSAIQAIRTIAPAAPIFFQSIPTSMSGIKTDPTYANEPDVVPGLARDVGRLFDQRCAEAGIGIYRYVPQPPATLDEDGLTKDEFIVDGVGFNYFSGRAKAVNIGHGNQAYGIIMMRELLNEIGKTATV
jgi:hypothetical protein